ncbi:MAG TPA: LysR family transcriptional regulator [Xanthobacteraceae bacterium]
MHQVRYFLAAVSELNFTKAAEKCNVSQPSLTRAIKQLEAELGGDLFRRERPQAQLTELGERMLPLLKQCYDSALGARSLASAIKSGEIGTLRLALSRTIELAPVLCHLDELSRLFSGLDMKLLRGSIPEIVEHLKRGDAELAIAGEIGEEWERLDRWPLFTERFDLLLNGKNELASKADLRFDQLRQQRFLRRVYCENAEQASAILRDHDIDVDRGCEVASEHDLLMLVEAQFGVAIAPRSLRTPPTLSRISIAGLELSRTVYVYGVAGRRRTPVASAMLKMLRAYDWSTHVN